MAVNVKVLRDWLATLNSDSDVALTTDLGAIYEVNGDGEVLEIGGETGLVQIGHVVEEGTDGRLWKVYRAAGDAVWVDNSGVQVFYPHLDDLRCREHFRFVPLAASVPVQIPISESAEADNGL